MRQSFRIREPCDRARVGLMVGDYVAHLFTKHDAGDIAGRLAALEAEHERVFVHLRKAACFVAGGILSHDSLRVRLLDCRGC